MNDCLFILFTGGFHVAGDMKGISIRLTVEEKKEIEDFFLSNRIKNYQHGYVEALRLGISQMKKQKQVGGKN
jgi:hypothetical protein